MKEICKLNKQDLQAFLPELVERAADCRFVCKKCGRLAPDKGRLCKPVSFSKISDKAKGAN